ncbi:carbohydrate ABC transporter permease [Treponema brennaborense]|uniref:ABC-type transporter, integral membrane subunit n=1 Tax=Treponema brennaborense (strain DSM 12168 / CIP 105900 / DD5/3) TaxID=906968 RepID=F4LMY6_TREBD|nr:carbohydrate ABC transporter permease [Treponema brennaborense]AEE15772.1 ABC-type transporter, integral membrane subunit [Treponema brennaborense DSM 12168]
MKKKSLRNKWITAFLLITGIGQLFPLIWLFDFSVAKSGDLFGSHILVWPEVFQWQNYKTAWINGKIPYYLLNSVIVNVLTILLTTLFAVMLAYAFTRMKWKLRSLFFGCVTMGIMIPIHATLLPNYVIFNRLHIADSYLGLILPYVAFALPTATFIMTGFMQSIPKSLEEAAIIDGCTLWGVLFRIVFPMVRPAMVTVIIMTFISTWNEFIMAATYISNEALRTLPYAVYNFAGQYASNYAVQFAVMMLVALPSLLIYVFLSDKITKGVAEGALKG